MSRNHMNQEQMLLKDSADRYLRDQYDFLDRRVILESEAGYDSKRWKDFAEFGWLGLVLPERFGGVGSSISDRKSVV